MLVNKPNKPTFASLGAHLLARKGSAQPSIPPHPLAGTRGVDALEAKIIQSFTQAQDALAEQQEPPAIAKVHARESGPLEQSSFSEFDKAVRVITGQMVTSEPTTDMPVKVQAATLKKRTKNKPEEGQRPRKAAFTLRLDPERHLRLRLLSAYSNRSSQQLVLEALDRLLENNATLIGCDTGLR